MTSLIQRAEHHLNRTALLSDGRAHTYADLLDASARASGALLGRRADLAEARIAFLVPPGFGYVAVQWGIWRAGGIAVPLCVQHPLPALQYVIEDTDADTLIVAPDFREMLWPLAETRGMRLLTVAEALAGTPTALPDVAPDRRAMILYTSGTTSRPKGVVTTHECITAQITTLVDAWAWQPDDHILNILPLHHVHGIVNVLSCALWVGATCQFLPRFDAAQVWDTFQQGKVNVFMAVPTIYHKLIAHWEQSGPDAQARLSAAVRPFRLMVSGSAALPVPVLERWRTISGHTLLERYGMTEIGMGLSNPYDGERRPGHVGQPLPGVRLRLVDDTGHPAADGQPGEIQVQGPTLFLEYWQQPEATRAAFQDGWFRTGDIAVLDAGSYQILGRNSVDIIKSGGYKISALQIEDVLLAHPQLRAAAVVGLPDEEWGEVVAAALVAAGPPPDPDALRAWMRARLPAYQIPRRLLFLRDLPRNTLGKVTKNVLKAQFPPADTPEPR